MKKLVALGSGMGWHVQDLDRAAGALGGDFEAGPGPSGGGRLRGGGAGGGGRRGGGGGGRGGGGGGGGMEGGGLDRTGVEGVLVRMMPRGSLERVVSGMAALPRLHALGAPVMNPPGGVEAWVDSSLALAGIAAGGLPVPPTW